jgi:signal transduction histidine kinase
MRRLMTVITGKIHRNGRQFNALLSSGKIDPLCQIKQFEGQNIIILPDLSVWKFSLAEIPVKRKNYFQLTASDISEKWKLTNELQSQNDELKQRQNELNETIANLHIVSHRKQIQNIKMQIHDLLGERLTLIQQAIRKEQAPDYTHLGSLLKGILNELKDSNNPLPPEQELATIIQTFTSFGVEILFEGKLPHDNEKSRLFIDITREAITNAARHGFASQVRIRTEEKDREYYLQIIDNGAAASCEIIEGGGLSGMRQRLLQWSGHLTVNPVSPFTLSVTIPIEGVYA